MIRKKREDIREKLTRLLSDEGLNHERTSAELLEKFADAAREHYAPLLIEARVWALKARLEPIVITRVLSDTRSFLSFPGTAISA